MADTSQPIARIETELTILATFLMGFIDAYTYLEHNKVFVSAQTGNMVIFATKLFSGRGSETVENIAVFAGFALGAFFGAMLLARIPKAGLRHFTYLLYVQGLVLLLLAIFQLQLSNLLLVFFLGLLSGYTLATLRKIGPTTVNNGIMTGNAKNLMSNLYAALFDKDMQAKKDCLNLAIGIIVFILGVGGGTLVSSWRPELSLWIAFLLVLLSLVRLLPKKRNH